MSAPAARPALLLVLLVPGAAVGVLAVLDGGFFAGVTGAAAAVLGVLLALRLLLARDPCEAVSPAAALAGSALALLVAWTLVSARWSDAPARATAEFDRVVLYLFAFALCASVARTGGRVRVLARGLAAAVAVVCVCGLVTRVLPEVWAAPANLEPGRLSWPVTYWNGLGLLAAVGVVLGLHHAADPREPAAVRVAAAALVPLVATTLLLTFSRGAIAVAGGGVLVYLVLARASGLPAALLATGPATAVAVAQAWGAERLASDTPASAAAVAQGERLALVLAACAAAAALVRAALLRLDGRVARLPAMRPALAIAIAALVLVAGAVALDLPERVQRQYAAFVAVDDLPSTGSARERLGSAGNNGRLEHWDVAVSGFEEHPLRGTGAGTYEQRWALRRDTAFTVRDAHSLYAEVLGELGLTGLVLLLTALVAILAGLARRVRRPDRAVHAALLACVLAWAVHAGVDWDWELPAVTVWVFAAGGLALARPLGAGRAVRRPSSLERRVLAALAVLVVAATPALVAVAHARLNSAVEAAHRDDCAAAVREARASLGLFDAPPEPYEVLAWCALRRGAPRDAVTAMAAAVEREPRTARLRRHLALTIAAAGGDPRPALRVALRLDPLDARALGARRRFADREDRDRRPARAFAAAGQLVGLETGLRLVPRRSGAAAPAR